MGGDVGKGNILLLSCRQTPPGYRVVHMKTFVYTKVVLAEFLPVHHYTGRRHVFVASTWPLLKNLPLRACCMFKQRIFVPVFAIHKHMPRSDQTLQYTCAELDAAKVITQSIMGLLH